MTPVIAGPTTPSRDVELEMFRKMTLMKLCDERLIEVIRTGRMRSPYYSPRGQEAIPAAISANLRTDDYVVTIYRGVHDHLGKGVPLKELFAEYAGRLAGSCKGKGGPMHITHPASGVMVTTGIVGSGLPIANGLAWASLIKGDGRICATNFGDGATNIGAFHEALNMASVWKLPVIFVCQNNGYGEHTRYDRATAVDHIAERAASYRIPGVTVDGNDPVAVWKVAHTAAERARAGDGPTLIEAKTFRFNGHNLGDPNDLIPKEVMTEARAQDPVPRYRKSLIDRGITDDAALDRIIASVSADIDEAMAFALEAPWPGEEELARDVYKQEVTL